MVKVIKITKIVKIPKMIIVVGISAPRSPASELDSDQDVPVDHRHIGYSLEELMCHATNTQTPLDRVRR